MSQFLYLPRTIAGAVSVKVSQGQRWAFVKFVEKSRRVRYSNDYGREVKCGGLSDLKWSIQGRLEIHCYNDTEFAGALRTPSARQMELFLRGKPVRFKG